LTVAALAGLLLAAAAIIARWRWLVTPVACVFLAVYTGALVGAGAPLAIVPALGFGLALVVLLEAADLAIRVRGVTVEGGVIRWALARWIGLGGGVFVAAVLTVAMAGSLAETLPDAAAPLLAAAGALVSVLIVAILIRRAA
ncbi:MAG TPA: hypothetical protein VLV15_04860, partial [Dongiaceae bacterium]|nr:hypothetical protein [Dongiaceae bacterium]